MTTVANAENRAAQTKNASANERDYLVPQVNILETKASFILEAEMPGVSKEGLEVLLEGHQTPMRVGDESQLDTRRRQ